jgi:uncharacterized membrane protein YqjE
MTARMEEREPAASVGGHSGPLRRLLDTALSSLHNRIDLFVLELQEEKQWLLGTLLWAGASIFFCGLAIIFVAVAIVWVVPESAQPWVLAGFSVVFLALAVSAVSGLRRVLREKPPTFGDTVSELKKDIEWIRSRD